MQDIADKSDSTSGSTGELTASEYNNHKNEMQNAVEYAGMTLNSSSTDQLSQSLFINSISAHTVDDSGSEDSVILSPLTGSSGLVAPDDYEYMNGGVLAFEKSDANTSSSVTINFGQTGTELGAKSIVRFDGTDLEAGDLIGFCFIEWDNDNDNWVLVKNGPDAYNYSYDDDTAFTPTLTHSILTVDTDAGDVTITIEDTEANGRQVDVYNAGTGICYVLDSSGNLYSGASATGIPISEGLKCTIKAMNDIWVADNEVTADYEDEDTDRITQRSDGYMRNIHATGYDFSATSEETDTGTYAVAFSSIDRSGHDINDSSPIVGTYYNDEDTLTDWTHGVSRFGNGDTTAYSSGTGTTEGKY